jgi:hypothetical protein
MFLKNIFKRISEIETRKFLIITFFAALLIRLAIVFAMGNWANPDLYEHGAIAQNMLSGHGYSFHWPYTSLDPERIALKQLPPQFEGAFIPPVSPYIIYWAFLIFGDTPAALIALMLFNSLCSALCIVVVFKITQLLKVSGLASRLSAIATALYLPTAFAVTTYSGSAQYHLLALLVMHYAILSARNLSFKNLALLGILGGILTLARSEFLIPAFLLIGFSAMYPIFKNKSNISFKNTVSNGILSALLCAAVIAPWTYRNYLLFDKFVPVVSHPWHEIWKGYNPLTTGGMNNSLGKGNWIHPERDAELTRRLDALPYDRKFEINADAEFKKDAVEFIKNNPGRSIFLTINKVFMLWVADYSYPKALNPVYLFFTLITVIPVFIGIFSYFKSARRERDYSAIFPYALFLLYYTAMFAITVALPRYQIYVVTVAMPFAGIGWLVLLKTFFKTDFSNAPLIKN